MLSHSVVFIKKINLLSLRHYVFLGNLQIFKTAEAANGSAL